MDPRSWNANMDATINIGLGTGSRDRDMAMLSQILNVQMAMTDRLAGAGFSAEALEMLPKINNTAIKLAESAGIKNPDQFYLDIKPELLEQMKQEAANRPDPEMAKEQMKQQTQMALGQQNAELARQADERKAQIEAVQMQADIQAQDRKTQAEMAQAQQDYEFKKDLAILQFNLDRELKLAEEARKQSEFDQKMAFEREKHQQAMEAGVFKTMQGQQAHEMKMEAAKAAPSGE
jgi:type IV secretory pathway VirB10-like protein